MKRIGIAASKMAPKNLFLYNAYVIVIAFLFSLLIFFIGGSAVVVALISIAYATKGILPANFQKEWISIGLVCMITLTISVGLFSLIAISQNLKLHK